MSSKGKMHRCDGMTVYHVGHMSLQPGEQLRRYYMHQHAQLVTQVKSMIDDGDVAFVHYLSTPEWQDLTIKGKVVVQKSDDLKMMIVLEAIFEQVRAKLALSLPSRLDCVFAWRSLELARRFRIQYLPEGTIHSCRVIEGSAVELDGGLLPPGINLTDLSPEVLSNELLTTQARAEKYWKAQASPDFPELLVKGSVEIVDWVK